MDLDGNELLLSDVLGTDNDEIYKIIGKRVNPKLIMENAKSIIVCAFPYYTGECEDSNLSKYCYGKDYHLVAKDYLQKICK
mgnify:CR=1 FL=1